MKATTKTQYNNLIKAKTWTKADCQRICKALNALRFLDRTTSSDDRRHFLIDWKKRFDSLDREYSITKEHSTQGIEYLRNYCFTTKGVVRKSCKLGYAEQDIVKNFSHFKFIGYYTEYNQFGNRFYHIVYRCYDKFGRHFDYCPMHWSDPYVVYTSMQPTKRMKVLA